MASGTKWQLSGDYFENCNCDVVCPCLVSRSPPLTAKPTQGECDVAIAFHIDRGSYGQLSLDGLNVVVAVHTPGPMADGNWSLGAYIDERATDDQAAALGAIFGGGEGGPLRVRPLREDRHRRPPTAAASPLVDRGRPGQRRAGRDAGGARRARLPPPPPHARDEALLHDEVPARDRARGLEARVPQRLLARAGRAGLRLGCPECT